MIPASSRVVLNALPGTVIDIVWKTRLQECLVRLRVHELKRAGYIKVIGRKPVPAKKHPGGAWCIYGLA